MKKTILTLVLGTTLSLSSAFAENELALVPYDAKFAAKHYGNTQEEVESWGSLALNKTAGAAKYVGGKLGESGAETAKYLLASNLNYYGVRTLEELTAYGIYAGTSLVAGPVAGNAAYYVTKGAFTAVHWIIPGFDGFIAGTYAPLTKSFVVDPLVNNAPAIAKATVSAASTCASYAKSTYNYFMGS